MMANTHAKFAPLDLMNSKMKGKRRFFTQTEHPLYQELLVFIFYCFSTRTYTNKCSGFWIPSSSALRDSQSAFPQRFKSY